MEKENIDYLQREDERFHVDDFHILVQIFVDKLKCLRIELDQF